ncbi:MAG: lipoate--protein ligase [Candidatus Cryptobacteroides sp.]
MTYISLPKKDDSRRLVFYLAMEEYVASHLDELFPGKEIKEAFFMWQVPPTVIFGRNQVMEAEVNMPYCKEKGIRLFRRKSGGGCVYSDWGNIMLSYITDSTDVAFTFEKYLQRVALILRNAGLNATTSGRNDILVDGRKVSGNAFFLQPKSSIVHGTMLYDSDFDELVKAITPSQAKIQSKGVESVRQHVTNLRPYFIEADTPWKRSLGEIGNFKKYIAYEFCGIRGTDGKYSRLDEIVLSDSQISEIEKIEAGYLDPSFLEGRNHSYTASRKGKIEGVGEVCAEYSMVGDTISRCHLSGDFFPLKDGLDDVLTKALEGRHDTKEDVLEAIGSIDFGEYVGGLSGGILVESLYK